AGGKVFIVAPDQFMTAFDADNGRVVWRKKMPSIRVRESIGLSKDSLELYVKTTDGKLFAVSATAPDMLSTWNLNLQTGYDVSPGPAIDNGSLIFVSSNSGIITAIDKTKQKIAWRYKVSNSLVTGIMPLGDQKLVVSTVDGKITCLQF
ncbi:MAG TPA: PQQ-binding-like beta-propeller repeat protein, partial [Flavisolibacter sp.]|nr:PQQ-binding-like beta-propeller repeat protein [Flavisolibacter sp.]